MHAATNPLDMLGEAAQLQSTVGQKRTRPAKKTAPDFTVDCRSKQLDVWFRWKKVRSVQKREQNVQFDLHFVVYGNYGEVNIGKIMLKVLDAASLRIPERLRTLGRNIDVEQELSAYFRTRWQEQLNNRSDEQIQLVYDEINLKKTTRDAERVKEQMKQHRLKQQLKKQKLKEEPVDGPVHVSFDLTACSAVRVSLRVFSVPCCSN